MILVDGDLVKLNYYKIKYEKNRKIKVRIVERDLTEKLSLQSLTNIFQQELEKINNIAILINNISKSFNKLNHYHLTTPEEIFKELYLNCLNTL